MAIRCCVWELPEHIYWHYVVAIVIVESGRSRNEHEDDWCGSEALADLFMDKNAYETASAVDCVRRLPVM